MIIFLIIVLSLMLKLTEKQRSLANSVNKEIERNQYSGGAPETTWNFVFAIRGGAPHVAFVPRDVARDWNVTRYDGESNVI